MADTTIFDLIGEELERQRDGLELIPSENYVSEEVLRAMGSLFMHMIRPEDTAARFGGEEFVLLFPEIDKQLACAIAERIRIAVEKNVLAYNDVALRVTVSIGVCVIDTASFARNHDSAILHTALNHADEALYFAKNSGRNRVALYSPEGLTLL